MHSITPLLYRNIVFSATLVFLLLGTLSFAQTPYTWLPLPKPTTNNLKSTFFLDSLTGWVGGTNGVIFKTTDGGKNWIQQSSGTTAEIVEISFLDQTHGWILATKTRIQPNEWYGTFLLSTVDGGTNWVSSTFDSQIFYALSFLDTLNGWIGGEQGKLIGTTNGGKDWADAVIESLAVSTRPIKKIKFWSPMFGIAVGGTSEFAAVFRRTTDGGATWKLLLTGNDVINDFHFIDSLNIVAVGGGVDEGSIIGKSTNAGISWLTYMAGYLGVAGAVGFRTPSEAFAPLLFARTYIHTLDSGKTWTRYDTPNLGNVTDIFFTDPRHGYMVGDSGYVFKYNPNRIINVSQYWNIISLPVSLTTHDKSTLFPTATSSAFSFTETGYAPNDSLENRIGYWLKFPANQSIEIGGFPITTDSISVRSGWNMIGSISDPLPVANITTLPGNISLSTFFEYNNGYSVAEILLPGKGYWVKSNAEGVIILNSH